MEFDEYQRKSGESDLYDAKEWRRKGANLCETEFVEKVMGLVGETGETTDKIKKIIRDREGKMTKEDKLAIEKELGDVLWYVAGVARYLEMPLSEVAAMNIEKLKSRMARGKIHGEGDER